MTNYDIIKMIYQSDRTGNLTRAAQVYNNRVKNGINSFEGIENYKEIFTLLIKLSNAQYVVTENDKKILQQYNVFIPSHQQNVQNVSSEQTMKQNKSFVAVSDFHGYRYPLDKIKKYYLNEYDVIYILGDATDRGEDRRGSGGIQLLIEIMQLSKQYPGKIIYVPGNHDEFLIGYVRSKYRIDKYYEYDYQTNLKYNGGEETINELNTLEKNNPRLFNELITWLGKQPIQRTHRFENRDYVFGHAMFNQKLYDINPNYSLEDYFKEEKNHNTRRMANSVLWFRKFNDTYNSNEMPNSDKIMVIGHTRESDLKGKDINLIDSRGRTIKVHCVDGGIAYKGRMLKYDGASETIGTTYLTHNDTSKQPPKQKENLNVVIDKENIFKSYIICKVLNERKQGLYQLIAGSIPKELNPNECKKIIEDSLNMDNIQEEYIKRSTYVKTTLFEFILENQIKRMQEQYSEQNYSTYIAAKMIDTFLNGTNDRDYITRNGNNGKGNYNHITSKNYARELTQIIGPKTIKEVLYMYGCETIEEYLNKKYLNDKKYSTNQIKR